MIQTNALSVGYSQPILEDLSLTFAPGQLHALLGPNGCGKTTLFKTLMGLLTPLAGSVSLHGKSLSSLSDLERARQIAYVPQIQQHVFPYTAIEMVLMGRTAHVGMFSTPSAEDHDSAEAALAQLQIAHLAHQEFTKLSGGQRQLVILARALAQGASMLVLDEPTASLDFGNEIRVLDEVARLAADGWTVVLSTHNPTHAMQLADQVVVLKDGRLLDQGAAKQILTEDLLNTLYDTSIGIGSVDGLPVCVAKPKAKRG